MAEPGHNLNAQFIHKSQDHVGEQPETTGQDRTGKHGDMRGDPSNKISDWNGCVVWGRQIEVGGGK
jgi:hypothetical protein